MDYNRNFEYSGRSAKHQHHRHGTPRLAPPWTTVVFGKLFAKTLGLARFDRSAGSFESRLADRNTRDRWRAREKRRGDVGTKVGGNSK